MPKSTTSRFASALETALSPKALNQLGREKGQSRRLRVVTPARLAVTLLAALGGGVVVSIADILREFNFRHGTATRYKAFYNRLAHAGFAAFMKAVAERLLQSLTVRTLGPAANAAVAAFDDIVVHDGSSFAVKDDLQGVFPGRFTTDPAAVELHATFSGFLDEVTHVSLAPDKEAERPFLPPPETLKGKLLLADRGYPSVAYFEELEAAGASFIMRISRSWKPRVTAVHHADAVEVLEQPTALRDFLRRRPRGAPLDLDIELAKLPGKTYRLVLLPGQEPGMTRLCTLLPRADFSVDHIARLYRFRWQIELVFKEWKSHANLHAFNTANQHIAEGLIWASLAAAILKRFLAHAAQAAVDLPISTRKVAMCAQLFLGELCSVAVHGGEPLRRRLLELFGYLAENARRANPPKERKRGRLSAGLQTIFA